MSNFTKTKMVCLRNGKEIVDGKTIYHNFNSFNREEWVVYNIQENHKFILAEHCDLKQKNRYVLLPKDPEKMTSIYEVIDESNLEGYAHHIYDGSLNIHKCLLTYAEALSIFRGQK